MRLGAESSDSTTECVGIAAAMINGFEAEAADSNQRYTLKDPQFFKGSDFEH